jgi:CheY-like chemotaxis protein
MDNKKNILVVDDDEAIVKMFNSGLTRAGYSVEGLLNSVDALKKFIEKPDKFDLILTDLEMPVMMGNELAEEIKKIRPNIPIILCSGKIKNFTKKEILSMGFCDCCSKSDGFKNVLETIKIHCL